MVRRWHKSPFLRIALILPLVTGLLIAAMLVPVYNEAIFYIRQEVDSTVMVETVELLDRSQIDPREDIAELLQKRIEVPIDDDAIYLLRSPDGHLRVANLAAWPEDAPLEDKATFRIYLADGRSLIGRVSLLDDGSYLLVGRRSPLAEFRQHMGRQLVLSAVAVTLLCGLITFLFMRQMQRRLALLARDASIVESGATGYRLHARMDGDELDELASRFNEALVRIEHLIEAARHVSTAIAHDMRRPLIRLRNRIERAQHAHQDNIALDDMLSETDRVLHSFAALLRLARIEAGTLGTARQELNLVMLLTDVADLYEPSVRELGRRLLLCLPAQESLRLLGDRELLFQALTNLIENALRYGNGDIELHLASAPDNRVALGVRDYGPGVPQAALPHLFERFYRVDASRSDPEGAGIGLALVAGIAAYHGGHALAENTAPGLRVTLVLPALT